MKILKSPYFIVALFALTGVAVYLFLPTTKEKSSVPVSSEMAAAVKEPQDFDFEEYLGKVNATVNEDSLQRLSQWLSNETYDELTAFYHQRGESVVEAYYTELAARKMNNVAQMEHAGDLFEATSAISNSEEMKTFLINKAVAAYETALASDTTNLPLKMKLAGTYIEQGTNPMQGIGILLDIVKKDPNNADAQLMLGKFAMMSGQFEKAIQRLEKVIYLRPRSNDVLFLLAIAHENNGNKQKALELLEQCKKQEQNPDLKREIDSYINRLKQSL